MGIQDPVELFFLNLDEEEMKKIREDVGYYLQDDRYLNSINYLKKRKLCDKVEEVEKSSMKEKMNFKSGLSMDQKLEAKLNRSKDFGDYIDLHDGIDKFKFKMLRENIKSIVSKQKKWKNKKTIAIEPNLGFNIDKRKLKPLRFNHDSASRIVYKNSHYLSIKNVRKRNKESLTRAETVKKKMYLIFNFIGIMNYWNN